MCWCFMPANVLFVVLFISTCVGYTNYVTSYARICVCVCVVDANFWQFFLSGKPGQSTSHVGSFGVNCNSQFILAISRN